MYDTISHLVNHPAFQGFGEYLLPWYDNRSYFNTSLTNVGSLIPYHSHVDPGTVMGLGWRWGRCLWMAGTRSSVLEKTSARMRQTACAGAIESFQRAALAFDKTSSKVKRSRGFVCFVSGLAPQWTGYSTISRWILVINLSEKSCLFEVNGP